MLHIVLADGFEEIEALATIDILRRCGLEVQIISVTGKRLMVGAHNIPVQADTLLRVSDMNQTEGIILPGGMPGASTLAASDCLRKAIRAAYRSGKLLAAICAAPMVLGQMELLKNKRVTCYPGFEEYLIGANVTGNAVEKDGQIITGNGPGAAIAFAFAIASEFVTAEVVENVRKGMMIS